MAEDYGEIEKVEQKFIEEMQIEWRIPDFLSVAERGDSVISPNFSAGDDSSFYFVLCTKSSLYPEFMSLCLKRLMRRVYAVEYKSGLKRSDGSVLYFVPGIIQEAERWGNEIRSIRLSELLSRKSELVPGNVLTVTCCTLRREITHSIQPIGWNETKSLKLIRLDTLSENFKNIFDEKETCDATLKVKEKEYKVHKTVLMARSPVFAAAFKHDTLEKQTGVITIPDCDPDSFQLFLEYLYCGKLQEISFRTAFSLFITSDKYDVPELKEFCVNYLIQCLSVENVCEVVVLADMYDETELFCSVQKFFNENVCEIFKTPEWDLLMETHGRLAMKLIKVMSKLCVSQKT